MSQIILNHLLSQSTGSLDPINQLINTPSLPVTVCRIDVPQKEMINSAKPLFKYQDHQGQVIELPLDYDNPDAHQILSYLDQLIVRYGQDPQIRETAIGILSMLKVGDNFNVQAQALTEFVRDHLSYVADPMYSEYVVTPIKLLLDINNNGMAYGDCDDHVLLLGSLLHSIGMEARPVAIKLHSKEYYDHVILSVIVNGRKIYIDPTVKGGPMPLYRDTLELI